MLLSVSCFVCISAFVSVAYFLLCFELLSPPPSIYSVRSPPEGGKLSSSPCQLSHIHKPSLWLLLAPGTLAGDSRSQFTKTCVSICAVCETLLRGAIRKKIKRREESQTCSFSYSAISSSLAFFIPSHCCRAHLLVCVFDWPLPILWT